MTEKELRQAANGNLMVGNFKTAKLQLEALRDRVHARNLVALNKDAINEMISEIKDEATPAERLDSIIEKIEYLGSK